MTENPIDLQIGVNIRQFREERKISREALGISLSTPVSGTAVEKYESGQNRVSARTLVEIAAIFNCRVSELFHGIEGLMKVDEAVNGASTNNPKIQQAVANLVKAITLEMSKGYRVKA